MLLIGNTEMTRELVESLGDYKTTGYKIVGVVGGKEQLPKLDHISFFSDFDEVISHGKLVFSAIIRPSSMPMINGITRY